MRLDRFCWDTLWEFVSNRLLSKFPPPPAWLPGTALALTLIWNGSFSSPEMSILVMFDGFMYFVFGEVMGFKFLVDISLSVDDYWKMPSCRSVGSKTGAFWFGGEVSENFIYSAIASTTYWALPYLYSTWFSPFIDITLLLVKNSCDNSLFRTSFRLAPVVSFDYDDTLALLNPMCEVRPSPSVFTICLRLVRPALSTVSTAKFLKNSF